MVACSVGEKRHGLRWYLVRAFLSTQRPLANVTRTCGGEPGNPVGKSVAVPIDSTRIT